MKRTTDFRQQTSYNIHEWRKLGRNAANAGEYKEVLGNTLDPEAGHFHSLLTLLAFAGQEGALYADEVLSPAVEQDSASKAWYHLRYAAMHMDDANAILLDTFYEDLCRDRPSSERIPIEEERTLLCPECLRTSSFSGTSRRLFIPQAYLDDTQELTCGDIHRRPQAI